MDNQGVGSPRVEARDPQVERRRDLNIMDVIDLMGEDPESVLQARQRIRPSWGSTQIDLRSSRQFQQSQQSHPSQRSAESKKSDKGKQRQCEDGAEASGTVSYDGQNEKGEEDKEKVYPDNFMEWDSSGEESPNSFKTILKKSSAIFKKAKNAKELRHARLAKASLFETAQAAAKADPQSRKSQEDPSSVIPSRALKEKDPFRGLKKVASTANLHKPMASSLSKDRLAPIEETPDAAFFSRITRSSRRSEADSSTRTSIKSESSASRRMRQLFPPSTEQPMVPSVARRIRREEEALSQMFDLASATSSGASQVGSGGLSTTSATSHFGLGVGTLSTAALSSEEPASPLVVRPTGTVVTAERPAVLGERSYVKSGPHPLGSSAVRRCGTPVSSGTDARSLTMAHYPEEGREEGGAVPLGEGSPAEETAGDSFAAHDTEGGEEGEGLGISLDTNLIPQPLVPIRGEGGSSPLYDLAASNFEASLLPVEETGDEESRFSGADIVQFARPLSMSALHFSPELMPMRNAPGGERMDEVLEEKSTSSLPATPHYPPPPPLAPAAPAKPAAAAAAYPCRKRWTVRADELVQRLEDLGLPLDERRFRDQQQASPGPQSNSRALGGRTWARLELTPLRPSDAPALGSPVTPQRSFTAPMSPAAPWTPTHNARDRKHVLMVSTPTSPHLGGSAQSPIASTADGRRVGILKQDSRTGVLGVAASEEGEIFHTLDVHPAFRNRVATAPTPTMPAFDEFDEVISKWETAGSSAEKQRNSLGLESFSTRDPASPQTSSFPSRSSNTPGVRLRNPSLVVQLRASYGLPPIRVRPAADPRVHPHHSYVWDTQKVYCRLPEHKQCVLCQTHCCIYHAAQAIGDEKTWKEEIRFYAGEGIEGFETMLKCSDCEKLVCPKCAGRCPESICGDVTCKECKTDLLSRCDYHG